MSMSASSSPARTSRSSCASRSSPGGRCGACSTFAPARAASRSSRRARSRRPRSTRWTSRRRPSPLPARTSRTTALAGACICAAPTFSPRSALRATTSSSPTRLMSVRLRWRRCRPSTGTSRAWRSPAAPMGSPSSRASSPRHPGASRLTAFLYARSAMPGARWSGALRGCSSPGRSPKCSPFRAPRHRAPGEGPPVARQARDELALAARELLFDVRLAAELGEQAPADGNVVQLAEVVLDLLERCEIGLERRLAEAAGERITGVAQALHPDAQLVALVGVLPVDAAGMLERLAMQTLERTRGERRERRRRLLPRRLLHPLQRPHEKAVKRRRLQDAPRRALRLCLASARSPHEPRCFWQRRHEDVPVARGAEHRGERAQPPLQRLCARRELLERIERGA